VYRQSSNSNSGHGGCLRYLLCAQEPSTERVQLWLALCRHPVRAWNQRHKCRLLLHQDRVHLQHSNRVYRLRSILLSVQWHVRHKLHDLLTAWLHPVHGQVLSSMPPVCSLCRHLHHHLPELGDDSGHLHCLVSLWKLLRRLRPVCLMQCKLLNLLVLNDCQL